MKLEGSCHCQSVTFSLTSAHPYPFNVCYCSICRKTAGSGGSAINLSGAADSLKVKGKTHVRIYQAKIRDETSSEISESPAQRSFCGKCGSHLWVWDPRWPDLIHPHAGAIDTELPAAPERTHLMLASKPAWVALDRHDKDQYFDGYPSESIAEWHERLGLASKS